jgi:hypothetical protein
MDMCNYDAVAKEDGKEALDELRAAGDEYDLLLLDL